jgi:signal peptidase I
MSRVERNQALYTENIKSPKPEKSSESPKAEKRQTSKAGKLLIAAGRLVMLVVVAACLSLVIPHFIGYETYVVVSGSMEPNIPVGSIVYSKKADPAALQTGDVIVFVDPARGTTPITHRVVTNDTAAGTIVTKGDANEAEDVNPATYDNIKGKVAVHIPRMGFVASALTSFLGKLVAILMLMEAWLLIEIGNRLKIRS